MFDKQKYLTCGINSKVPLAIQLSLWHMIEKARPNVQLDYLQIFRLSVTKTNGMTVQKIIHEQENPPYKTSIDLPAVDTYSGKIYVIDDDTHSTMLLPEEY